MKTLAIKKKVVARIVVRGLLLVFTSKYLHGKQSYFIEFGTLLVEPRTVFYTYDSSSSVAHEL